MANEPSRQHTGRFRAITGGTGRYDRAEGEATQTAVGVDATGLFNFTFDFELRQEHAARSGQRAAGR